MPRKSVESSLTPYLSLLGKVPDQDVATKAGVSRAVTVSYRKKLGIPAYEGHRHRGKTDSGSDAPKPTKGRKSKTPFFAEKVADAEIVATPKSRRLSERRVKKDAVRENDVKQKTKVEGDTFRGRRSALDNWVHLLGKMPDADVARQANVTPENVRTYRNRRGIPAFWRTEPTADAPAAPLPEPTVESTRPSAPPPVAGRHAWAITVDYNGATHNYVVVGGTIRDAAESALAKVTLHHPDGVVRQLSWIGELL